ncbi:hypothetical protein [Acidihalobacter prosperus]
MRAFPEIPPYRTHPLAVDEQRTLYIEEERYDFICPVVQACELYNAWSSVRFEIIPDREYSHKEFGMMDAPMCAANECGTGLA